MFLFADTFFAQLAIFRLLWIRGRLGGGKTLLAVAIADELIKRGIVDGCIANIPTALKLPNWREKWLVGSCILFDEAWTILDNRRAMSNSRSYGAFARKMESYWIFPSVIPIDKRISFFYCERGMRLVLPFIGEIWVYNWGINLGYTEDKGFFVLYNPSRYFGMYDTKYIPLHDADIAQIWERTVIEMKGNDDETGRWYTEPTPTATSGTNRSQVRAIARTLDMFSGSEQEEG